MRLKKLTLWVVFIIFITSIPGCFHSCDEDNIAGYEPPDEETLNSQ